MSDDELRLLEREAATNEPRAYERLARALERAGRPVDALAALVRGANDLGLRRQAARYPRDVAPLRRAPRVRWQTTLDFEEHGRPAEIMDLVASPLGIAARTRDSTVLLDADSGAVRARLDGGGPILGLDEVLLVFQYRDRRLRAHDLWTGQELHSSVLEGYLARDSACLQARDGILCIGGRQVFAYGVEEPRDPPSLVWRSAVPCDARGPQVDAIAGDVVVVFASETSGRSLVALAADDGRERFRIEEGMSPLADERTMVVSMPGRSDLVAVSPIDGHVLWGRAEAEEPLALLGDELVAYGTDGALRWIDRSTGRVVRSVHLPPGGLPNRLAGDLLVRTSSEGVDAVRLDDGSPLWVWSAAPARLSTCNGLRLANEACELIPGRLVTVMDERTVVCLEEDRPSAAPASSRTRDSRGWI